MVKGCVHGQSSAMLSGHRHHRCSQLLLPHLQASAHTCGLAAECMHSAEAQRRTLSRAEMQPYHHLASSHS